MSLLGLGVRLCCQLGGAGFTWMWWGAVLDSAGHPRETGWGLVLPLVAVWPWASVFTSLSPHFSYLSNWGGKAAWE